MPNRPGSFHLASAMPRADVSLYGLVHGILEAERARDAAERRDGRRHPYGCIQWIARMQGDRSPSALRFRPVQCVDLSAAGLLYLAEELPEGSELIVALRSEPPIYLQAQVVRTERTIHAARLLYRVACRFIGRAIEP